ncbi:glycosyltransferase family 9 protein [Kibdelosporangium persicum]|uniref:Lipopolysaccharide core heptosyltransferase RfaQ n=1 Tax=Kibdelosporangium persicum TaxID=2698649 RepID=A0ABX2F883_9PSEU|nr:glycosyltransferase family 9 protein [Kibdelosporangium persicum]NRN67564.1 Lipopolysaccharide core heptosyltransferase RfaQ [Kibdelosporangium persicum]
MTERVLVVRLDSDGDVLASGPAVRAAAAGRDGRPAEVTFLCGPRGRQAAGMLPGVRHIIEWVCPWIVPDPPEVSRDDIEDLVGRLAAGRFDVALVLTSFHQSPLPMALLLRLAGVPQIAAISPDYPGSLLDHRIRPGRDMDDDQPEPLRALRVATEAGFALPAGDGGKLKVLPSPEVRWLTGEEPYVVLHPGASVPARAWSPSRCAEAVAKLRADGWQVVVTGSKSERELTAFVSGCDAVDLGGRTAYAELAGVLAGARAVVVGNTGPAHLAAAVGTPVVSLFAPVVPAKRWAPYGVPVRLLGDQQAACAGSRATRCPLYGHPCLNSITADDVVAAVNSLVGKR